MKKILMILLIGIFFLSSLNFIYAEETLFGTHIQGDCIELIQLCSSCTFNNISGVLYPNKSTATGTTNIAMTRDDTFYNFTFCDTQTLGIYNVNGFGDLEGIKTPWSYDFEVTPSGFRLQTSQSIVYIIVLIMASGLFFLSIFASIRMPWKNPRRDDGYISHINYLKHGKLAFGFFSYLLAILILNILMGITRNFLFLNIAFTFFKTIYFILLTGLIVVVPLTAYIILMNLLTDKRIKEFLSRGINVK